MNQFIPARWATFIQAPHAHWTMEVLNSLYGDYSKRPYHNWTHIRKSIALLDWYRDQRRESPTHSYFPWREAELALLWHDVVYVAGSHTNEEDSVSLLKSIESKLVNVDANLVYKSILSTKNHSKDAILEVVDIDFAILGAEPLEYGYYTHAVRVEFGRYDNATYAYGRGIFLKNMLERDIFSTAQFKDRFEKQARVNIESELKQLTETETK